MRVVHFARSDDRPHAEALCGAWGSLDSDWTDVARGVTCTDCRTVLRDERAGAANAADRRRFDERRHGDGW